MKFEPFKDTINLFLANCFAAVGEGFLLLHYNRCANYRTRFRQISFEKAYTKDT